MTERTTMFGLLVGLWLLSIINPINGQTTNATCPQTSITSWMFNKDGESPCMIWAKIQSLCLSSSQYINVPPLMDQSYGYNLPNDKSSMCQCNSVSYSLMSACALCQFPLSELPTENDWKAGCGEYSEDGLGFDQDSLSIPDYAFHQWSGGVFNADTVKSDTAPPASSAHSTTLSRSFGSSTATPSSSISPSNSSNSSTSVSSSSEPSTSDKEEESKVSWGPIIGGVAGGIVLLVLIFLLFRWFRTKNNPNSAKSKGSTKRLPYPYPTTKGEDSFLDMLNSQDNLGNTMKEKQRLEALKRRTDELMLNPNSFQMPRTAPLPFTPKSPNPIYQGQRAELKVRNNTKDKTKKLTRFINPLSPSSTAAGIGEKEGYTTTTQRLANKPISIHSSDLETGQNQSKVLIPPKQRLSQAFSDDSDEGGILSPQDFKQSESNFRKKSISPLPPVHHTTKPNINRSSSYAQIETTNSTDGLDHPSMDFSIRRESRPISENTLPSLYEPRTGAKTYYARNSEFPSIYGGEDRDSRMFSPESQYPLTASKTPKTSKSRYIDSQYTLDNYPAQETLLNKLKEKETNQKRNSTETQGTIGAALGSGKRGSWWDKRWSNTSRESR